MSTFTERPGNQPLDERMIELVNGNDTLTIPEVAAIIVREYGIALTPQELANVMLEEPTRNSLYDGVQEFLQTVKDSRDLSLTWSQSKDKVGQLRKINSSGLLTTSPARVAADKSSVIEGIFESYEVSQAIFIDDRLIKLNEAHETIQKIKAKRPEIVPSHIGFRWLRQDPKTNGFPREEHLVAFLEHPSLTFHQSFVELQKEEYPNGPERRDIHDRRLYLKDFDRCALDLSAYAKAMGKRVMGMKK